MSSDFSVSTSVNQKLGYGIRKRYKVALYAFKTENQSINPSDKICFFLYRIMAYSLIFIVKYDC